MYLCHKTSYLYVEANCTQPSPSDRVPNITFSWQVGFLSRDIRRNGKLPKSASVVRALYHNTNYGRN
jgi:hypothetical protein